MGIHENIDKLLNFSPRIRIACYLGFIVLLLVIILGIYKIGEYHGKLQVNRQIQQELDDSKIREQGIRAEAENLAGINDVLRSQSEAQAKLLVEAETKRNKGNAEKLQKIFDERQKKINEIESEADLKKHVRSLCDEVKTAGYQMSDAFCSQAN